MTIDGDWQGTIGRTLAESVPHFREPPHPGSDAPDVVAWLTDGATWTKVMSPDFNGLESQVARKILWWIDRLFIVGDD